MTLYLVHFTQPFAHAQHYLGFTDGEATWRLGHHARGTGANLLRHVAADGTGWDLTRIWRDGDRTLERRIKDSGTLCKVCPVCNRGHRFTWPDNAWIEPANGRARSCRCGQPAAHLRPWGRGTVGLCIPHAARYAALRSGATPAEIAAGAYRPTASTGSAAA